MEGKIIYKMNNSCNMHNLFFFNMYLNDKYMQYSFWNLCNFNVKSLFYCKKNLNMNFFVHIKITFIPILSAMYLFSEMEVKSVPTEVFGSLKIEEEED